MATVIRAEISERNKYWIDKHRHYELKHFCLQYPTWKKKYREILSIPATMIERIPTGNLPGDRTANYAIEKAYYSTKIDLIENAAKDADEYLYPYILKAVTEGLSFPYLKTVLNIPCGKDMYYDRYRRFFWLLSLSRD